MGIRLIALDLDGTTIGADFVVHPRVAEAVRAAQERGVHVTLATGRSFAGTRRFAEQLNIATPLILYQGSLVAEPRSGQALFQVHMPEELMLEAVDLAHARNWHVVLYDDTAAYVDELINTPDFYEQLIHPDTRLVPDLRAATDGRAVKFLMMDEPEKITAIEAALHARFDGRATIVRSHANFVEGNPLEVSKGRALAWLAERLGVHREQVLAVGDSDNDVSMVEWAGAGVAMGQAHGAVRQAADWIAPRFAEGGAAMAIERYVLGRGPEQDGAEGAVP